MVITVTPSLRSCSPRYSLVPFLHENDSDASMHQESNTVQRALLVTLLI